MSDVLHHAHLTPTQAGAVGRRLKFLRSINARAEERKVKVIPIAAIQEVQAVEVVVKPKFVWQSPEDRAYGPVVHPNVKALPTCEDVIRATAQYFGLSRVEIKCARRQTDYVHARHIAMYLCSALTLRSLPHIGRLIGGRDHTTCLHGIRKIQAEILGGNANVLTAIDAITASLTPQ